MSYILVVDDEPLIALVLQEILSDMGHTVVTASDGLVAMRHLKCMPTPDLVLVDLNLPFISGADIVRHMRKVPRLRRVPILIITASITKHDLPPSGTYQQIISKPFDVAEVCDVVSMLLESTLLEE